MHAHNTHSHSTHVQRHMHIFTDTELMQHRNISRSDMLWSSHEHDWCVCVCACVCACVCVCVCVPKKREGTSRAGEYMWVPVHIPYVHLFHTTLPLSPPFPVKLWPVLSQQLLRKCQFAGEVDLSGVRLDGGRAPSEFLRGREREREREREIGTKR